MHIISEKKLRDFWKDWPEAEEPLRAWIKVVEHSNWENFAELKEVYPRADLVGRFIVFDIGGNKFRLVVAIRFKYGKVYIRHVMTHKEYDRGAWKGN